MASVIKTLQKGGDRIYPVTYTNAVKDTDGKLLSFILKEIIEKLNGVSGGAIGEAPIDGQAYVRSEGSWKIIDFPYQTMEIDHIPGLNDLTYIKNGKTLNYPIGAEVYYRGTNDTIFYKLYDFVNKGAYWQEIGRATFVGFMFLKGANYFDSSVKIIKQGTFNG